MCILFIINDNYSESAIIDFHLWHCKYWKCICQFDCVKEECYQASNTTCNAPVIYAVDDRYLVLNGSVHECLSLRLRRGVKMLMIKAIKLNINIFGLSQGSDLGT